MQPVLALALYGTPLSGGFTLPLDQLSATSVAAYSLRKVRSAYTGNCIRVRRSSDDVEQDIGFVAGILDTAAIATFVGGGNGFVATWYDQSGNGFNLTQATAISQPRIVNSGVLELDNGKPSVYFDGTDDYIFTLGLNTPAPYTINTVFAMDAATGDSGTLVHLQEDNTGHKRLAANNEIRFGTITGSIVDTPNALARRVSTHTVSTTTLTGFTNGTSYANATQTGDTVTRVSLGCRSQIGVVVAQLFYTGFISEQIIFASVLSTSDRQSLERNQGTFYGITVA